jgi:hypothetical protein
VEVVIEINQEDIIRFMSKVTRIDGGCWEWTAGTFNNGYGVFELNGKTKRAHRVSYEIFVGEIPVGKIVMHSCDNPRCVNPKHLSVGTVAENNADKVSKKRDMRIRGENNHSSRLKEDDVIYILSSDKTSVELAEEFHISPVAIGKIRRRVTWKDVNTDKVKSIYHPFKLTQDQVDEIKQSNEKPKILSQKYGVHVTHIWRIRSGIAWR